MTRTARRERCRLIGALTLAVWVLAAALAPEASTRGETPLLLAAAPDTTPGPVTISTIPAVSGFPVTLDGVTALTDDAGQAHMATGRGPNLAQRVSAAESADLSIGGVPVEVHPARIYASDRNVQIAVDVDYFVRFNFADTLGDQLDGAEIDTVVVKSETGEIVHVPAAEGSWLQGNRVVGGSGAPRIRDLAWSVQEVQFAGSNVVNASQQRFVPAEQQNVAVELLFFSLTVHMHDAFFGFPQDGSVELEYPDKTSQRLPLDEDGSLTIPALPRGNYTLTAVGPGPRMSQPLAISRTQDIQLAFYSWLDIASVTGLVLGFLGGLAWVGAIRRGRRPARHRRLPERSQRPEGEPGHPAALGEPPPAGHATESSTDDAVVGDRGAS